MNHSPDLCADQLIAMPTLASLSEVLRNSVLKELEHGGLCLSRRQREVLADCLHAGLARAITEEAKMEASTPSIASLAGDRALSESSAWAQADSERTRQFGEEQRARRHAERMNRLKDEFLATVSHELRAPLQAILGWARMLKTGDVDLETVKKGIEVIERNANMQAHLVEDILDVSAIIAGKLRIRTDVVDLPRVVDAALETVRPAALAKGVTLTSEIHANAQTVIGDADRLQQVVWNLLANAVKFTPRGGQVRLRVSKVDSQVDLVVVDDGRGIERDFLPFVFDRFRQAEGGSTREHGGLGLGLAIVRHFTEAHGGTVSAESDGTGSGATFRVSLPVGAAAKELPPLSSRANESIEPPPPPQQVLDGLRILVVDDEEDARELLGLVLRQYGAHVSEAHAAKQGLSALGAARFDVIVSDIGMPGEDGHAFIRQVRSLGTKERASRTPAIALTAYARIDDRRKALAAGFQMHLAKPIKAASLVAAVAQLGGRGVLLP